MTLPQSVIDAGVQALQPWLPMANGLHYEEDPPMAVQAIYEAMNRAYKEVIDEIFDDGRDYRMQAD